jgi:hypothetical protein
MLIAARRRRKTPKSQFIAGLLHHSPAQQTP